MYVIVIHVEVTDRALHLQTICLKEKFMFLNWLKLLATVFVELCQFLRICLWGTSEIIFHRCRSVVTCQYNLHINSDKAGFPRTTVSTLL
jgi:hypothetical protein